MLTIPAWKQNALRLRTVFSKSFAVSFISAFQAAWRIPTVFLERFAKTMPVYHKDVETQNWTVRWVNTAIRVPPLAMRILLITVVRAM